MQEATEKPPVHVILLLWQWGTHNKINDPFITFLETVMPRFLFHSTHLLGFIFSATLTRKYFGVFISDVR